jgi:hypothetical protein
LPTCFLLYRGEGEDPREQQQQVSLDAQHLVVIHFNCKSRQLEESKRIGFIPISITVSVRYTLLYSVDRPYNIIPLASRAGPTAAALAAATTSNTLAVSNRNEVASLDCLVFRLYLPAAVTASFFNPPPSSLWKSLTVYI